MHDVTPNLRLQSWSRYFWQFIKLFTLISRTNQLFLFQRCHSCPLAFASFTAKGYDYLLDSISRWYSREWIGWEGDNHAAKHYVSLGPCKQDAFLPLIIIFVFDRIASSVDRTTGLRILKVPNCEVSHFSWEVGLPLICDIDKEK